MRGGRGWPKKRGEKETGTETREATSHFVRGTSFPGGTPKKYLLSRRQRAERDETRLRERLSFHSGENIAKYGHRRTHKARAPFPIHSFIHSSPVVRPSVRLTGSLFRRAPAAPLTDFGLCPPLARGTGNGMARRTCFLSPVLLHVVIIWMSCEGALAALLWEGPAGRVWAGRGRIAGKTGAFQRPPHPGVFQSVSRVGASGGAAGRKGRGLQQPDIE